MRNTPSQMHVLSLYTRCATRNVSARGMLQDTYKVMVDEDVLVKSIYMKPGRHKLQFHKAPGHKTLSLTDPDL